MINDIIICTLDLLFLLKILVILNIPRFKNGKAFKCGREEIQVVKKLHQMPYLKDEKRLKIKISSKLAYLHEFYSVQFSSVTQSCLTLCDPMNCSTPGLPVHHQLPEFTQTQRPPSHDAIQPSHLLSSPAPPAPNPSQHQSLFQ